MIHGVWGQKICYPANEFFQTRPPREKYVVCFGFLLRWLNCTSRVRFYQSVNQTFSRWHIFPICYTIVVKSPPTWTAPFSISCLAAPTCKYVWELRVLHSISVIHNYASPFWWNECMYASMTTSDYTRNVDCSGVLIVRVVCFLIPPWNVI